MTSVPAAADPVEAALAARRAGDLAEAARLCDEALRASPERADALHLKGVIALALGRPDEAAALLGRSVTARPDVLDAQVDLGVALVRAGRTDEALAAYDRVVGLQPAHPQAQFNRGNLLASRGRLEEAVAAYDAAVAADPALASAWTNRAAALQGLGRAAEAVESSRRAAELDPAGAAARFNLAAALQAAGRLEEALAEYAEAAALEPRLVQAHLHRAALLLEAKQPAEALAACGRAAAADPGDPAAWELRGAALLALGRPVQALAALDRALAVGPDAAPVHVNRGAALRELGRVEEAAASFRRALALAPDTAEARCNLAVCQLLVGDFAEGFAGHEQRWLVEPGRSQRRDFARPAWLGGGDLAGRTVLLHAEQGLGDTLQFCRYAPLVAARGARVVLEVQPPLKPLMAGLEGVARVVARGEPLPPFDLHTPLMSLPLALATRPDAVPSAPAYLAPPPERAAAWAERLGPRRAFRLGLVWSGKPTHHNDRHRSIPLAEFLRVLPEGVEAVALHETVREADEAALAARLDIRRFDGEIADFADTAALAAAMDLVVSVDTSAAHCAAAIGRPTWVLLPFAPDWRWGLTREDSPWYPTMRLFRQPALGDWASVLDRVRDELARAAGG